MNLLFQYGRPQLFILSLEQYRSTRLPWVPIDMNSLNVEQLDGEMLIESTSICTGILLSIYSKLCSCKPSTASAMLPKSSSPTAQNSIWRIANREPAKRSNTSAIVNSPTNAPITLPRPYRPSLGSVYHQIHSKCRLTTRRRVTSRPLYVAMPPAVPLLS